MTLKIPWNARPADDPKFLWAMQQDLLESAQQVFGPRDSSKTIKPPIFVDDGPHIRNTPQLDGAFAELSRAAERHWAITVFELSHETVHLLNPIPGTGSWLSEGMAVAFSMHAERQYKTGPQEIGMASYRRARELVSELPPNALAAGRLIREYCGSLEHATIDDLRTLFPSVEGETLEWLSKKFQRDWQSGS